MSTFQANYGPEVQRVSADTPVEDIIGLLKRDGGVFIKGLISEADLDHTFSECRHQLESSEEWSGSFFPKETQRAAGLMGLSPTYARTQVMNPLYQAVLDHFITSRTSYWWGDEWKESISKPYVHSCTAMRIGPGGKAQPLHRDDYISHNVHEDIDEWDDVRDSNRETAIGLFVAGCKVTKENGGTQFIPRSHLWGTTRGPPRVEDCIFADMDKGDAFLMLASAYHGGGNNTTIDQYRLVYATFALDRPAQAFMGYSMSEPACGYVDQVDPIYLLHPELKSGPSDF
ncbi:Phytanoyl-dioxygenase family protein [Pleurostoma richardsiae]|uniref:Phytanoyl-dioxygenase family protein n=1 Tax=Pleurostoma richardsiae TaxID=41990 RepID=A0AA38RAE3_9PEZI|nr:Phytanoyl-dioxygenase family protein [Pleurostoma richardsiae]